jgi:FtsH-binding integral membrane protein
MKTDYIIYILCWIVSIFCLLIPFVCPGIYIEVPSNYITLTIFTLSLSYLVATTTCIYTPSSVITALLLTFITAVSLTVYAWKTDKDFTIMDGTLFTGLVLLFFTSIIYIFIRLPILHLLILYGGLIWFSIYLIYDTQLILGGHRTKFSEDDYILASIFIYLDIIILFLKIIDIFGEEKDKEKQ